MPDDSVHSCCALFLLDCLHAAVRVQWLLAINRIVNTSLILSGTSRECPTSFWLEGSLLCYDDLV